MIEPGGGIFTYRYNDADRLNRVVNPQVQPTSIVTDALGRVTQQTNANGTMTAYTFDAGGRTTRVANTRTTGGTYISDLNYSYDKVDNPTQLKRITKIVATLPATTVVSTFMYDKTYQLTEAHNLPWPDGATTITATYMYDEVGNRTVERLKQTAVAEVRTTYTYDAANGMTRKVANGAITTYLCDSAGNQIKRRATGAVSTLIWDNEGRLKRTANASKIATFAYNPDNMRVRVDHTGPATTKKFIWDGANVLQETDAANAVQATYTSTPNLDGNLLSQRRGSTTHWLMPDALGSTDALTGAGQVVSGTYRYEPFGMEHNQGGNVITNPFLFVGRQGYYDAFSETAETLQYLRARYYDNGLGRFLSRDVLGMDSGDNNFYRYVGNSPTVLIDPSGLLSRKACLAKIASLKTDIKEVEDHFSPRHCGSILAIINLFLGSDGGCRIWAESLYADVNNLINIWNARCAPNQAKAPLPALTPKYPSTIECRSYWWEVVVNVGGKILTIVVFAAAAFLAVKAAIALIPVGVVAVLVLSVRALSSSSA